MKKKKEVEGIKIYDDHILMSVDQKDKMEKFFGMSIEQLTGLRKIEKKG